MDASNAQSPSGGSTYPSSTNCILPYASVTGYAVSSTVPLTQQLYYVPVSQLQPEKPPLPSYQEVREELGEKLHNLNRKQKRKMIKNKRNKLRKSMAGVKEEGEEPEDTEEVESEEHKKQARLWEERNRMMDEDNYSHALQQQLLFEKREKEEKEREYLEGIAKEVAKREAPRKEAKKEAPKSAPNDNPAKEYCLSYLRTGCCRFGPRCKMIHVWPKRSRGVLIHNMFQLPGEVGGEDSLSAYLEYSEDDVKEHFTTFFQDVCPEMEKFGRLLYLLVSSNTLPHLRGNVYCVWETREAGEKALRALQGRFYAGKELSVEYLPESVMCWKYGVCKECFRRECARGRECAYLHFYRNPGGKYSL